MEFACGRKMQKASGTPPDLITVAAYYLHRVLSDCPDQAWTAAFVPLQELARFALVGPPGPDLSERSVRLGS